MMKREPVVHGLTPKPRNRRNSATRSRSMIVKASPNLASSSSCHCNVIDGGAATSVKSMRRRSSSSRENEPGLDRLSESDIVGDQQIDAGQPERLAQRQELIGIEPDAGAKRRLQQVAIRRGRGVPFEGAEIGGKDRRVIGAVAPQPRPEIILEPPGADLRIPCDLQRLSLRIVRDARELQRGRDPRPCRRCLRPARVGRAPRRSHRFREPGSAMCERDQKWGLDYARARVFTQ